MDTCDLLIQTFTAAGKHPGLHRTHPQSCKDARNLAPEQLIVTQACLLCPLEPPLVDEFLMFSSSPSLLIEWKPGFSWVTFSKCGPRTTALAPPRSSSKKQTLWPLPDLLTQNLSQVGPTPCVLRGPPLTLTRTPV